MNAPKTEHSHSFDPAGSDPRAFRDALGQFGTGVTVVTCATPSGPIGITANSFASVSLDPPLVLWSPAKTSSRYPLFMAADHFAVHVIGADQDALCRGFARAADAFDGQDWETCPKGVPLLNGALARFECTTQDVHDAGDHSIVVARVRRVTTRSGDPLMFFGGRYGGFTDAS